MEERGGGWHRKICWIGYGIKFRHELHEELVKEDYVLGSQRGYIHIVMRMIYLST